MPNVSKLISMCVVTFALTGALTACGGDTAGDAAKSAVTAAGDAAKSAVTDAGQAAQSAQEAVTSAGDSAKTSMADAASADAGGAEAGAAGAVAAVATDGAAGPDLAAGEQTYGRYCFSCHASGVAGAPKLGVAEDWAPRVAKGLDSLVASTIEGIAPGMPVRGLCSSCTDDDMRDVVAWMIAQQ